MPSKLYYSPGACSFAVHVLLEEMARPSSLECVMIPQGMSRSAAFLRISPMGRVPVRVINTEVMTELPAMLLYLAFGHPQGNWLPTAHPMGVARCAEWLNWLSGTVHTMAVGQVWQASRLIGDPRLEAQVEAKGRINLHQAFKRIKSHFSQEPYAAGGQYSAIDPYLLVFYRWGNRMGFTWHSDFLPGLCMRSDWRCDPQ